MSTANLSEDLLVGASEIAQFVFANDDKSSRRRVYHLAEKKVLPIHRQPGLGLIARKSALQAHFTQLDKSYIV